MNPKAPIKKLIVTKETLKDLNVRTNIQTGVSSHVVSTATSVHPTSNSSNSSLSHSITSHNSFSV